MIEKGVPEKLWNVKMMNYCVIHIDFYLYVLLMIMKWMFLYVQRDLKKTNKQTNRPTYLKIFSMLREYEMYMDMATFVDPIFNITVSEKKKTATSKTYQI